MNATVLAARRAAAMQTIVEEVQRLGGTLEIPSYRVPDAETRAMLTLEAVALSLSEIGPRFVEDPVEEPTKKSRRS